jgi:hypothetical protein
MSVHDIRKGMPQRKLDRITFERRYLSSFVDPAFVRLQPELQAIVETAWQAYLAGRKAPRTRKVGRGFADPEYEISNDWLDALAAINAAQKRHDDSGVPARILLVNGSSRTEHTCPGEMSKTWRMNLLGRCSRKKPPSRSTFSISAAPHQNSEG